MIAPRNALLLENIHPLAVEVLQSAGADVQQRPGALSQAELVAALPGVQLLGIRSTTHVTEAVLDAAPDLEAIGAFCIGTNQIDLEAAAARGIAVFNAPYSNTRSVVELVIAEVIALTRQLTVFDDALHAGVWQKSAAGSHEVRGRTLGIIGYGNIGTQLSVVAESLGMRVVFYDTAEKLAMGNAVRLSSLEEVLALADVVTLHVDGRAGNGGLFGAEQFSLMKPGAVFLNLSRGFVVDHGALRDHLVSGHLSGAAVDVFLDEPRRNGDPFDSRLRGLPNVILTPHVGGSTEEAQEDIGRFVAGKLRDFAAHGSTSLAVNVPQVVTDAGHGTRLGHLHQNVPGVLATVNSVLARYGVNVVGQSLTTRGPFGYVVTDVPGTIDPNAVAALRAMPETVKVRVLG